jgi:hypothetical protein
MTSDKLSEQDDKKATLAFRIIFINFLLIN